MYKNPSDYYKNIDQSYGFDPSYLKTDQKFLDQVKHNDEYIYNLKKKAKPSQARRKIYENVQYTDFENQGIQNLKDLFEKENKNPKTEKITLPDNWRNSDWLKMCYTCRFETKKCLEKLREHVLWRNNKENHKMNPKVEKLLKTGFIYQLGKDIGNRPVIVLDCSKINLDDGKDLIVQTISIFLGMIKKYMFNDYAIENWVLILDLHGMGITSVPISALKVIIGSMSTNFCATLEKMFIVNPSSTIGWVWGTIEGFLDQETADKIKMIKSKKDIALIQTQIPNSEYVQEMHGGKLTNIVSDFWPPRDLYTDYEALEKKQREEEQEKERQKQKQKEEELEKDRLKEQEKAKKEIDINQIDLNIENKQEQKQEEIVQNPERQQQQDKNINIDDNNNNKTAQQEQQEQERRNEDDNKKDTVLVQGASQFNPGIMVTHVEEQMNPMYASNNQGEEEVEQVVVVKKNNRQQKVSSAVRDDDDDEQDQQQQQQEPAKQVKFQVQSDADKELQQNEQLLREQEKTQDGGEQNLQENSIPVLEGPEQNSNCQCQCNIF